MRPLILFVTGLALTTGVSNADIRGTVLDPSGRPIEGARVECGSKTVYTNIEGLYTIPGAQGCSAKIVKAGFKTITPQLTEHADAKLTLAVEGPFESVIVTATRSETTPEHAGVAASVLTARDFDLRNSPTVADVLREIPGVQV